MDRVCDIKLAPGERGHRDEVRDERAQGSAWNRSCFGAHRERESCSLVIAGKRGEFCPFERLEVFWLV